MKILYISSESVPGCNGGSVHTYEVAQNLVRLNHDVTLIAHRNPGQIKEEIIERLRIIRVNMNIFGKRTPFMAAKAFPYIKNEDFDLVMERSSSFGGFGVLLSRFKKNSIMLEVNSPHLEELIYRVHLNPHIGKLINLWMKTQYRWATRIITTSRFIIPREFITKVEEVSWGVNVENFSSSLKGSDRAHEIRRTFNLENRFVVLFVGSFRSWHGVLDIPILIEQVARHKQDVKFLLVGDGDCKQTMIDEIAEKGLDQYVVFTGDVPYDDIPYYMAAADIGIAPYNDKYYFPLNEYGFYWSPLKIFEYMASGLPVITADYFPINKIILDNECGKIAEPGDLEEFSRIIVSLSDNPDYVRRMGVAAVAVARKQFSWKSHTENLSKIAETLVHRKTA